MHLMQAKRHLFAALVAFATAVGSTVAPAIAAGTQAGQAVQVTVRMVEYAFIPNHLSFRLGTLYRLHLINQGSEIHEFTAPDFIKAIDLKNPDALGPYTNQFAVDPGETKDVYFIPRRAGEYKLICADHDWAGMTGSISIAR
jgi:uncharacterized cupredoxin-like copper-binding protein